ncbi:MAG: hypothetical protein ABR548_06620 [Actinomycetota bacterium]|nr:hypothetical protein [Actinomycetota bacterium]
MDDYPVKLGSMLLTIVEPWKDHQVAYNRWYERDHFYAGCMVGPGILAGRRFVATRPYKELRYPADSPIAPDPMVGSYLALYWISKAQSQEWGGWAAKEVHRLHRENRMFAERDHVHTKMYRYDFGAFRDDDGVPAELALDHPFRGAAVVIGEATAGVDRARVGAWYRDEYLPNTLAGSAVAMCLYFTPVPIPEDAPADVPRVAGDKQRFVTLWFLDRDPMDVWNDRLAAHGKELERMGLANLLWASPFIPTIPGTDTYTDQLW